MPLTTDQIPHVASLADVREIVGWVQREVVERGTLAEKLGCTTTTVGKRLAAARVLGWIGGTEELPLVTPEGERLLKELPGSPGERDRFRDALVRSPLMHELPDLLDDRGPTRDDIARVLEASNLARSTALARANALLSWRRTVLDRQETFDLPPRLSARLVANLQAQNPWWRGEPGRPLPATRRTFLGRIKHGMASSTAIIAVRGPRRVGKSIAQQQLIAELLAQGVPPTHILRVQFDDLPVFSDLPEPITEIAAWFEREVLRSTFNRTSHDHQPCWLFFDEVQLVNDWAQQLKHLTDLHAVRAVVTGSSALQIREGTDSLAGRIFPVEVGPLSTREIAAFRGMPAPPQVLNGSSGSRLGDLQFWTALRDNGVAHREVRDRSFAHYSALGGYPEVHARDMSWEDAADYLRSIADKVIHQDLPRSRSVERVDSALLDALLRIVCGYAGTSPGIEKLREGLTPPMRADATNTRLVSALNVLEEALLIRGVSPLEIGRKRWFKEEKLCIADPGLCNAVRGDLLPIDPLLLAGAPDLAQRAGWAAESVVGAWLSSLGGVKVGWLPASKLQGEVDFVVRIGAVNVPIEVKYRRQLTQEDVKALRTFLAEPTYHASFGVVITETDVAWDDPQILALPLSSVLLA